MESRSPFEELEHFAPPARRPRERARPESLGEDASARPARPARRGRKGRSGVLALCLVAALVAMFMLLDVSADPASGGRVIKAAQNPPAPSVPVVVLADEPEVSSPRKAPKPKRSRPRKAPTKRVVVLAPVAAPASSASDPGEPAPSAPAAPAAERARPEPDPPTLKLYRLYHQKRKDHFYTTSPSVKAAKQDNGWVVARIEGLLFDSNAKGRTGLTTDDGIVGYLWSGARDARTPLYLVDGAEGDFYTSDVTLMKWARNQPGWVYRGIVGYVRPA